MDRITKLRDYLQQQPDDSFLQHALALEYIKMEDDSAARQLFESLLAKDPGYVGSYYHLGKLLERAGDIKAAINIYEEGMKQAKAVNDGHAYNELQAAQDDIIDD